MYKALSDFITEFTNVKKYNAAHLLLPKESRLSSLSHIITFGFPKLDLYGSLGLDFSRVYYNVNEGKIYDALKLVDNEPGKTLSIKWKFKFVDPVSRQILPKQELIPIVDDRVSNSQIYVRLSAVNSTISPWFAFPFENINEENKIFLDKLKQHLPFGMSDKSWRKWQLSKNGNWVPRNLDRRSQFI